MHRRATHALLLLVFAALSLLGCSPGGTPRGEEPLGEAAARMGSKRLKSPMHAVRYGHTATLLADGRVLVAGGWPDAEHAQAGLDSAEIYDPGQDAWTAVASMHAPRIGHTATPLGDGRVLVVGGEGSPASAEIFDADAGTWSDAPPMMVPRVGHTATLLEDGSVLVAGGVGTSSVEIFHPTEGLKGIWHPGPDMTTPRHGHTATQSSGGAGVIVAGGMSDDAVPLDSAEVFDGVTWTLTATMSTPRANHVALLLDADRVLVAGGSSSGPGVNVVLASAEVFDFNHGTWSLAGSMSAPRQGFAAALFRGSLGRARVLVTGGADQSILGNATYSSAEIFDPTLRTWTAAPPMHDARAWHTATPLSDQGPVLLAGGSSDPGVELYDPTVPSWTLVGKTAVPRTRPTATLLADGRVLIAGGEANGVASAADLYDPAAGPSPAGLFHPTGAMMVPRTKHATAPLPVTKLLPKGGALVTGGFPALCPNKSDQPPPVAQASAEIFDVASGTFQSTPPMATARGRHTATLLDDGRVLVAGGLPAEWCDLATMYQSLDSVELFDPSTGQWTPGPSMKKPLWGHTATLLEGGKVLVAGGFSSTGPTAEAEIFDPAGGSWTTVPSMHAPRYTYAAVRLADGRVLVAGGNQGQTSNEISPAAELYDPRAQTWIEVAPMNQPRFLETAALLPDGRALVAGGASDRSTELFDPGSGVWAPGPAFYLDHVGHAGTSMPDGSVLVIGGEDVAHDGKAPMFGEIFRLQGQGTACGAATDCQSGFCADGVCCDSLCNQGLCVACSAFRGASADGTCTPLHPDCGAFACDPVNGQCRDQCDSPLDCAEGFVCKAKHGNCVPPPADQSTLDDASCALGEGSRPSGAPEAWATSLAAILLAARRRRRT